MFEFTVDIAKPNPGRPFHIKTEGEITDEEAIAKTGICTINGFHMNPGDRIVVRGPISRSFPVRVHAEWAMEFRGKRPEFFSQVLQSWFDQAGIPEAETSTWAITLDWDGCDMTLFPEPEYQRPELRQIDLSTPPVIHIVDQYSSPFSRCHRSLYDIGPHHFDAYRLGDDEQMPPNVCPDCLADLSGADLEPPADDAPGVEPPLRCIGQYSDGGSSGSIGFLEFQTPGDGLQQIQSQRPGYQQYCIHSVGPQCAEDLPPGPMWANDRVASGDERLALLYEKLWLRNLALPDVFHAWVDGQYISHTPEQEALKILRREAKTWARSVNSPNPSATWTAIYRCALGDWDLEKTLVRVRANHSDFSAWVEQVRTITGIRPEPFEFKPLNITGFLFVFDSKNEAEMEALNYLREFGNRFLNVKPEHFVVEPARSEGRFLISGPVHFPFLWEEVLAMFNA